MFSNQSAEVSLNAPCRSVAAVLADRAESRFLVGTCSVQEETASTSSSNNQLHVVRYHSDVNVVGVDASLEHPTGPIQHMCASPQDRTLVLTLPEGNANTKATLYKIPFSVMEMTSDLMSIADSESKDPLYHDSITSHAESSVSSSSGFMNASGRGGGEALEAKLTLESSTGSILDMQWRGASEDDTTATPGDVVTLDDTGTVMQWDISMGMAESMTTLSTAGCVAGEAVPSMARPRVAWDPHQSNSLAVSWGSSIRFLDLRSSGEDAVTGRIARAHRYGVTDMDFNPNKPYTLATSGLDGLVHYWDIRSTRRPVMTTRGGHSHYAWRVQYNPFHDQLVLSTGTDAVVNLWRMSTISSAPLLPSDGSSSETSAPNVRVARHEQGDSVYGAVWGAADAWMYMTVAYDGKVALHHVPSKEKYKILL